MTMHLIKSQIFTHANRVTKFSCTCVTYNVMYVYVHLRACNREPRPAAMSKRKKKTVAFTAKRRKDLVVDLGRRDYAHIVDSAIAMTQHGVHLKLFPPFSEQMILGLEPVSR